MIGWLLRFLASLALAVATVLATLDATRSVAAGALVTTPLGESWNAVMPEALRAFREPAFAEGLGGTWRQAADAMLAQPGFAVLAVLALALYVIGMAAGPRRRHRQG